METTAMKQIRAIHRLKNMLDVSHKHKLSSEVLDSAEIQDDCGFESHRN